MGARRVQRSELRELGGFGFRALGARGPGIQASVMGGGMAELFWPVFW